VVESVAENTVDAIVAPAMWAMVAGAPGVVAHRAVNTMDSMIGHRDDRYAAYGWAAARLDDAAAWVPARATAALDVRLGGENRYADRIELRPVLGDGRPPERRDIRRASRLSRDVTIALATSLAVIGIARTVRR
jgi:adenosylcobinamide-phosphate synthase